MHRISLAVASALLLVAFALASRAEAKDYTQKSTQITVTIPDSWVVEREGDNIQTHPKDETVHLSFLVVPLEAVEETTDSLIKGLQETIADLELDEGEEDEINGMKSFGTNGTGKIEGKKAKIALAFVHPPVETHMVFVIGIAEADAFDKHEKETMAILESFRPAKKAVDKGVCVRCVARSLRPLRRGARRGRSGATLSLSPLELP